MTQRNSNIELLRVLLMIAICLWHTFVHGLSYKNMWAGTLPSIGEMSLMCMTVPAVNCFMLISGYFGMKLSLRKFLSFSIQASLIFWLVVGLRYCGLFEGDELNAAYIRTHLFPIITKVWWFLTEYVTILVLSPIINKGILWLNKKEFFAILLFMLLLNGLGLYIAKENSGSNLLGLLTIYLLGRYLNRYALKVSVRDSILIFVISTMVLVGMESYLLYIGKGMYCWELLYYCNPVILLQAAALFFIFLGIPPHYSSTINWMGSHCFAIYLITEKTEYFFYRWWADLYRNNILWAIGGILCVCIGCMLIDALQNKVNVRIVHYIMNCIKHNL